MGIPPDPYPVAQPGQLHAGTTSFDPSSSDALRDAQIRGHAGSAIHSLSVTVVPPPGAPSLPITAIKIGRVNGVEPQIVVRIESPNGKAIPDGYLCQFSFISALPL